MIYSDKKGLSRYAEKKIWKQARQLKETCIWIRQICQA